MTVQLEYINCLLKFSKIFPIMLALCLMLSVTYYAQNYAGIISWSLLIGDLKCSDHEYLCWKLNVEYGNTSSLMNRQGRVTVL